MREGFTTVVLYHPSRPLNCLIRVLKSLNQATKLYHKVELVVQGNPKLRLNLPRSSSFNFDLDVIRKAKNTGVAFPLHESILRLETTCWAKVDDDIFLHPESWDLLLECIREPDTGYNAMAAFISPGKMSPRLFKQQGNKLLLFDGSYKNLERAGRKWSICDYTGLGATIVLKEAFDAGICIDGGYFVAGENLDFCYQLSLKGMKMIHMFEPRCRHEQKGCQSPSYAAIRWNRNVIADSALRFKAKWGLINPQLWEAGGLK